jgi:hypothetical protein
MFGFFILQQNNPEDPVNPVGIGFRFSALSLFHYS